MKQVAVVTGSRADYGILVPVMRQLDLHPEIDLIICVTGPHLRNDNEFGMDNIRKDGWSCLIEVPGGSAGGQGAGQVARGMAAGIDGFSRQFDSGRPDLLLVLGDRTESYAAGLAALVHGVPVAHMHGGELTIGMIDDALRHSLTKIAQYHFVASDVYRQRVIQMGEAPERVFNCGSPGIDSLHDQPPMTLVDLSASLGFDLNRPFVIVTWHAETASSDKVSRDTRTMFDALAETGLVCIVTGPNNDMNGQIVREQAMTFCAEDPGARLFVENLGMVRYASAMQHAAAMIGNSSSGISEAGSFRLPVVNIGTRQSGRLSGMNVMQCQTKPDEISQAIDHAISPEFRRSIEGMIHPYGDKGASKRIADVVAGLALGDTMPAKGFYDIDHSVTATKPVSS